MATRKEKKKLIDSLEARYAPKAKSVVLPAPMPWLDPDICVHCGETVMTDETAVPFLESKASCRCWNTEKKGSAPGEAILRVWARDALKPSPLVDAFAHDCPACPIHEPSRGSLEWPIRREPPKRIAFRYGHVVMEDGITVQWASGVGMSTKGISFDE